MQTTLFLVVGGLLMVGLVIAGITLTLTGLRKDLRQRKRRDRRRSRRPVPAASPPGPPPGV